jgi:hypothetical protein
MSANRHDILYFAETNTRGVRHRFGVKAADLRFHMYVVGKTGVGKSTLLKTLALQDALGGRGFALLDPHGDLVLDVLKAIPARRRSDVEFLDTPAGTWTFNPLADVPKGAEALAVAELVEVFRKMWIDDWGPRLEHVLRNVLFTLIEMPGSSFADANRLLTDHDVRTDMANGLSNEEVKAFWLREFNRYSPAFRAVVVAPLQNKLGALLTDPRLKAILCARKSSFSLRAVMDEGRILLVNLARGRIGEGPATILGSLLAARIGLAGLARADQPEAARRDFHLYLDECHLFATVSLATMLAELRKYRVALVLANQYLGQLEPAVRDALFGNAGTLISFRIGAEDAAALAREMAPAFSADDFVALPNHHIYLRLMIDAQVSRPFSATTIAA